MLHCTGRRAARWSPLAALTIALAGCGPSGDDPGNTNGNGNLNGDLDARVSADASPGADASMTWLDGGNGDALAGCNPKNFTLQQAPPPAVMLVIDRSGSMLEPGSTGQTRWQEVGDAVDLVVTQFEAQIRFGLLMYPTGDQCLTPPAQVAPGLHHLAPITHHLQSATPGGGTPTAAALRNAGQTLQDMAPGETHFVILATDGGPNCNYGNTLPCTCSLTNPDYCCTSYPDGCVAGMFCLDDAETLQVIGDLGTQGTDTFVIGLDGSQEYVELLDAMAVAGGRPQVGGATDYYAATNQSELTAALQAIAGSVISCTIALEEAPEFPDLVTVYVDGAEVPRDASQGDGWDYTDASLTEIELFGPACDNLQDGQTHNVTATFACVID
jgi:hypothetical protein